MPHRLNIFIFLIVALCTASLTVFWCAARNGAEQRGYAQLAATCQDIYGPSTGETRACIHHAGIHRIDPEYHYNWTHRPELVARMTARAVDQTLPPPSMECFARSVTMRQTLAAQGVQSHNVVMIRPHDAFPDHVMLEVLNPESGHWEMHDPSFNVVLADAASYTPLSLPELIAAPLENIIPCRGAVCSWDLVSWEGRPVSIIRNYLGAAAIRPSTGTPAERFYINKQRFDLDQPFQVNGKTVTYRQHKPSDIRVLVTTPDLP